MNDEEARIDAVRRKYGPWTAHNIDLPGGSYTMGPEYPQHDLLRGSMFVEIVSCCLGTDLSSLTVLDLGCLEGAIAIQFARAGASVDAIDIRPASVAKAEVARSILGLQRLRFFSGDALDLCSIASIAASYDVVICAGLLYHIDAADQLPFLTELCRRSKRLTIVDTHIALQPSDEYRSSGGYTLHGKFVQELPPDSRAGMKDAMWAALNNTRSFWLSEHSLVNVLKLAGFSAVMRVGHPYFAWTWKDRGIWAAYSCKSSKRFFDGGLLPDPDLRPERHPTSIVGYNVAVEPEMLPVSHSHSANDLSAIRAALSSFRIALESLASEATPFWWRDDDSSSDTPELRQMLALRPDIPMTLAVIPALADTGIVSLVNRRDNISIAQHGWRHFNHSNDISRPNEFPNNRDLSQVLAELSAGSEALRTLFGDRFKAVFVPPWHRCTDSILQNPSQFGFSAISIDAPLFPLLSRGADNELNVEIDTCDWVNGGAFIGAIPLMKKIIKALTIRRDWNAWDRPIGILTHHMFMSSEDWTTVGKVFEVLDEYNSLMWTRSDDLLSKGVNSNNKPPSCG